MAGQGKQGAKGKGGNPGAKQDANAKVKGESRTAKKAAGKAAAAKSPVDKASVKKAPAVKKPAKKVAATATRKPAKKVARKTAKSVARKAAKKSATAQPAKKRARRIGKKASQKTVKLGGKAVNLGPERGDNSFPPSNKGNAGFSGVQRTGSPAADSSSGPGGLAKRGGNRGEKGGGVGTPA